MTNETANFKPLNLLNTNYLNEINLEKFGTHFHEAAINEKQIDDRLTQLADFEINKKAKVHTLLNS